tara:strand:- start:8 stop:445 length:438 start_codon:yes stop_codon:yes gene_type:complete
MAVSFTNNWSNILNKIESVIETEFKGALPVFKAKEVPQGVSQALQINPISSSLSTYMISAEMREFDIEMNFIFNEVNVNDKALDHILRNVSRIEALMHDNMAMTLSDSSSAFNCRLDTTTLNAEEDSGFYVVRWEYKCQHLGNLG